MDNNVSFISAALFQELAFGTISPVEDSSEVVCKVPSLKVEEPTTLSSTTQVAVSEQNETEEGSPFPPQPKLSDYYNENDLNKSCPLPPAVEMNMTLGQFFASAQHFGNFERQVPASEKLNFSGNIATPDSGFEPNEPAPSAGVWICVFDNMCTIITSTGGNHTKQVADKLNLVMVEARKRAQEQEDEADVTASVAGSTSASSSVSKSSSWETVKKLSVSIKGSIKSRGSKLAKACKTVVRKMTTRAVPSKTSTTNAVGA